MKPIQAATCRFIGIALKSVALILIVAYLFSNHPPSLAQSSRLDRSQEVSAEDVRQDTEIDYIKAAQTTQIASVVVMQATIVKQGEDLARLDTKITMLFSFLGLLQVGGLFLSIFPLKRNATSSLNEVSE